MKLNFSVFRTMMLSAVLFWGMAADARVISGTVKDQTGETIISASVVVKGTSIGTVTDFDGNYTLDVPDDAKVLVFSYIGMKTQELNITGNVMDVVLSENSEVLEEVVVTGYGTTKKRDLVTSVASVNADQLKDIPVASASEALQGKLAGVSVTTTEGSPDADVKIRVRGGTSLTQSSDPLYIVDGFQVSSISDIAPGDIASMDVLKDAAATAIYGAQGANGVIIITTKDADNSVDDKMQIHFDYTGYMGWKQMAKKYDMLGVDDFVLMQYEYAHYRAKGNTANIPTNFNQYFDPRYAETQDKDQVMTIPEIQNYWHDQKVTDWQDETFGHHGLNSNHSFTVSGGNKAANFSLSYNRIDDEGIMYGSDYDRNNLSFKAKFKPIKDLTLSFTARYSNTQILGSGTNTAQDAGSKTESRVRNAIAYSPIELFAKDNVAGLDDYESFGSLYDPITTIDHNYRKKVDDKFTLQGYASYKFLKMFTIKTELGYEGRYQKQDRYYGPTTYFSRAGDGFTYAGGAGYGHIVVTDDKSSRFKNTNTLEFKKKWGDDHDLGILIGEEMQILKGELRTYNGYGYDASLTGKQVFNYIGSAKDYTSKSYVNPTDNMLSFFARANYVLFSRYYLTATFRADASTRFAKGNQWGFFPSAAIAWRIIDEEWMAPAQDVMSNFKLRLSYGSVGNNNVDLGYLRPEYLASATAYTGIFDTKLVDGGADVIAANNKLKWETTVTRDLGIDFGFWNERFTGTIDLYWNNTKDLILKYKMAIGGYNYQYRNIGSTDNKGVELSLNGVILDKRAKSLSYGLSVNANISHNYNKVVDLGGMDEYLISSQCFSSNYANTDYEFKLRPGDKVGNIYGYQTAGWYTPEDFVSYGSSNGRWYGEVWEDANQDGVKQDSEVKQQAITTILGEARPGMTKIVDQNGDGVIDDADRVVLGNTQADIQGGFGVNFNIGGEKWGKVDLSAQFTYSVGNEVLNLSALDYGTIFDKSKLRNNTSDVAFGMRYSLFMEGDKDYIFIPSNYGAGADGRVSGEDYAAMAAELARQNAGATTANPISDNIALTDKYVENASFLRLSSLTIGYSLPDRWIGKAYIKTARIFFTASNLFCATPYSGADPEVDTRSKINPLATGVDFSAFPKSRAFNFGINLSF
ncbi:MAG: TonB-dependent receptor [Paludibacteraceae bacterium]|nr:TonB-dependent receptor [Paludibacteraceae bacterium]